MVYIAKKLSDIYTKDIKKINMEVIYKEIETKQNNRNKNMLWITENNQITVDMIALRNFVNETFVSQISIEPGKISKFMNISEYQNMGSLGLPGRLLNQFFDKVISFSENRYLRSHWYKSNLIYERNDKYEHVIMPCVVCDEHQKKI